MVNLLIPNNCNVNFVASQPLKGSGTTKKQTKANIEDRFRELVSDEAKNENLLFMSTFSVGHGEIQQCSKHVMKGYRAQLGTLLESCTSHSFFRVTVIQ